MIISKTVCFIPAKAASTRLKKKNILKLDGKEMIYYPIHNALECGLFDAEDVIVSTESEEIKAIAESFGANVPYLRPEKLAHDPYGILDVVLDFLERFPNYQTYDTFCTLLPTAPLMIPDDICGAYEVFEKGNFNAVMSVTEMEHSALRSIYLRSGNVVPVFEEYINKRSQLLEPTYRLNGAVTFLNIKKLLAKKNYFLKPWGAYAMPGIRSVDIDNEEGYLYAQFLVNRSKSSFT